MPTGSSIELDEPGIDRMRLQKLLHLAGKTRLPQLRAGDIDRHARLHHARGLPGPELATHLLDHPEAQGDQESAFFGHAEEVFRAHAAAVRLIPLEERFDGLDPVVSQPNLRLVRELELPPVDRGLQLVLEPAMRQDLFLDARREELECIRPLRLRVAQGAFRVRQQCLGIAAFVREDRDADAGRDRDLSPADVERLLEGGPDLARNHLDLARAFDILEQHGKPFTPQAREKIALATVLSQPLHDRAQQLVAGIATERFVHGIESIEVEQQQRQGPAAAQRASRRVIELVPQVLLVRYAGQPVEAREVIDLVLRPLALDGIADGAQDDATVAFPLDEVVLGALVQNVDGEVFVVLAAEHDDRHELVSLVNLLDTVGAAAVGKVEIEQHDVEPLVFEHRHRFGDQAFVGNVYRVGISPERHPQKFRVVGIVLDQQYFSRRCHDFAPTLLALRGNVAATMAGVQCASHISGRLKSRTCPADCCRKWKLRTPRRRPICIR
jgi:hypothetical protein